MLKGNYFVTGTDTEIGKTFVSSYLLNKYNQLGFSTLGLKPVAAGAENGVNEDAKLLQQASSLQLPIEQINPFCFERACAPHVAAFEENKAITAEEVVASVAEQFALNSPDLSLVEGAGGWCVPLNDKEMWVDVVKALKIPVIIVVGMRLGCLNHALLTESVILSQGLSIAGWVANCLEGFSQDERLENINYLKNNLRSPLLETIPWQAGRE